MRKASPKTPRHAATAHAVKTLWLIVPVVAALLIYTRALEGGFVWDDELQVIRNPSIRTLSVIPSAFTQPFWAFLGTGAGLQSNFYRPVQTMTYAVAFALGGLDPWWYHALSLFWHALASALVFLIAREIGWGTTAAVTGSLVFATHPVQVEAVAWIAGVPDVSCAALYFLSLWTGLVFLGNRKTVWIVVSAAALLFALFSKEMAITAPVALILLALVSGRIRTGELRTVAASLYPLAVAAGVYGIFRLIAVGSRIASNNSWSAAIGDTMTLAVDVVGRYLTFVAVPYPQSAFHLIPVLTTARWTSTLWGAAVLLAAAALAWRFRSKAPAAGLLLAMFLVMLTPVLFFSATSHVFAERYMYVPLLAAALGAGALAARSNTAAVVVATLIAVYAGATWTRIGVWKDSATLYQDTLAKFPEIAQINTNMADINLRSGSNDRARSHLETAIKNASDRAYPVPAYEKYRAFVGLGAVAARQQQWPEAKEHLRQALAILPDGDWAHLYLGGVLMQGDRDFAGARQHFEKAIAMGPLNETARDYMGSLLFNLRQFDEAEKYFREALRINPMFQDAALHLEMVRRMRQQPAGPGRRQ